MSSETQHTAPSNSRTWAWRAAYGFLALAVLYLGAAFVLSRFLNPEELASWLEPRLETALNRDVEVGQVKVGFLPLGFRLSDLTVSDPTGLAPNLVHVGSMDLRVKLLPLVRREIQVSRLTVDGLRGDLRVSDGGRSNFGDLSTRPGAEAGTDMVEPEEGVGPGEEERDASEDVPDNRQRFALNLQGLRLVNSEFRYVDTGDSVEVGMADVELRASVRRGTGGGWLLVGSAGGALTLQFGEAPPFLEEVPSEVVFDAETDGEFDGIRIQNGEIRLGRIVLAMTGEVNRLQDPIRYVSLAMIAEALPLADLLTFLPDSVRDGIPVQAEGWVAADLRAEGEAGVGDVPTVTGTVALDGGRITLGGSPVAEGLTADLDLGPDRAMQTQAHATVLGGSLSLEGTTMLGSGGGLDLALRATSDLGRIESVVELPEGVSAKGQLATQLRIVGPIGRLHDLRFRGNVTVTDLVATHPGLGVPLEIQEGGLRLDGVRALVQDLPILLGDDHLTLSGELPDIFALLDPEATAQFNGSVHGPRVDLTRLSSRPLPDSALTYGRVAFAKVGGRQVAGRSFRDAARELGLTRPDSLPLAGSVALAFDTVIDRAGRMEAVRGQLEFGPSFVRLSEARFNRYGGEIRTSADLSLAPDDSAPFSFRLHVQNLDATGFLSRTTSLGRFVRGKIDVELDLIGTLDGLLLPNRPALVGSGSFTLTGGGLANAPLTQGLADFLGLENLREPTVRDWGTAFVLEQGRIRLADAIVQGAPGSPRVGGSVGLDGGLDLQSVFSLPSDRLSTDALERLGVAGEIAEDVAQRPEVVQAVLRISGSVFDPSVQADPRATALTIGAAIQEEVTREAQERIDAQRAEGERILQEQQAEAQRRIVEQRERLQTRATGFLRGLLQKPDTVRPDSVRPDTARADSLLPDTLLPDTLVPDTLRPDTLVPDTLRPDTLLPDTVLPDTIKADTVRPDTTGILPHWSP
jgi:hypothetical protein